MSKAKDTNVTDVVDSNFKDEAHTLTKENVVLDHEPKIVHVRKADKEKA